MKHQTLSSVVIATVLLGCSGRDEVSILEGSRDEVSDVSAEELAQRTQALMTEMGAQVKNPMRLIGQRTWKQTVIEFLAMPQGVGSPIDTDEVLISRRGPISDGDIVAEIYADSEVPLSPAEVWLALDDDDKEDLPSELAAHHLRWTKEVITVRRSSDFLRLKAADVERQVEKSISDAHWATLMNPAIPAHHYEQVRNDSTFGPPIVDAQPRHTCLEVAANPNHFYSNGGLATGACANAHYATNWVRHGLLNTHNNSAVQAPTAAVVQCAGWLNQPLWFCNGPFSMPWDSYWIGDSTAAASKVISYTFTYPVDPVLVSTKMLLGSAKVVPN